jgi:hypothetical protein
MWPQNHAITDNNAFLGNGVLIVPWIAATDARVSGAAPRRATMQAQVSAASRARGGMFRR